MHILWVIWVRVVTGIIIILCLLLFRIINCALAQELISCNCCSVKIIKKFGSMCLFKLMMMSYLRMVQECYTAAINPKKTPLKCKFPVLIDTEYRLIEILVCGIPYIVFLLESTDNYYVLLHEC